MSNNYRKWPWGSRFVFKDGRGNVQFEETEKDLDLADYLMLNWPYNQRTVYLHFNTKSKSKKWQSWVDDNVQGAEELIKEDLMFDGYRVMIKRLSPMGHACSFPFVWKLVIRS